MDFITATWVSIIFVVNILFLARKGILKSHGRSVRFPGSAFEDWESMNEIIKDKESLVIRLSLHIMNNSIIVLYILGALIILFQFFFL